MCDEEILCDAVLFYTNNYFHITKQLKYRAAAVKMKYLILYWISFNFVV